MKTHKAITFAEPGGESTYTFKSGEPYLIWDESAPGMLRRPTPLERLQRWVGGRWTRVTRWWRPRVVTSAIDIENGIVTLATERWSWRRWRWERP